MKYKIKKNPIVISLGGSIIYPDKLNTAYIKKFASFIRAEVKKGKQFIIVLGGGQLARGYMETAKTVGKVPVFANDWLGIEATRLNAKLMQTIFTKISNPEIITKRGQVKRLNYPITFSGGWLPGASTDRVATWLAIDFKADVIINAGKPDHVYTSDPSKNKRAKPINELTWEKYLKIIPNKWTPGLNTPFDPLASEIAQKANKAVIIIDGRKITNFKNLLNAKAFKGTIIQ